MFILLQLGFINAERWHLHNSVEYYVSNRTKNFDKARKDCNAKQAELVMIQTADAQDFLQNLFSNGIYPSGTKLKLLTFCFLCSTIIRMFSHYPISLLTFCFGMEFLQHFSICQTTVVL